MDLLNSIAVVVGCAAVVEDVWRGRISNWTSGGAVLGGLIYHGVQQGWAGAFTAVLGTVVGFGIFLLLYLSGGMGGGDVKLLAGFGSLLGPGPVLGAAFLAAILGAVLASVVWAVRSLVPSQTASAAQSIPYSPAITLGAFIVLFSKT